MTGIVTQTLNFAKSELIHFTAIFFFILWIYAQAGHFMYGADMPEFAGVMIAFQSCFDILLGGGDFDRMVKGEVDQAPKCIYTPHNACERSLCSLPPQPGEC